MREMKDRLVWWFALKRLRLRWWLQDQRWNVFARIRFLEHQLDYTLRDLDRLVAQVWDLEEDVRLAYQPSREV